jgi:hypothetical protein
MLRPVIVRGFGRRSVFHCQCRTTRRRIHVTPICLIDDSDKVAPPPPEENTDDSNSTLTGSAKKDSQVNSESTEKIEQTRQDGEQTPLPARIREAASDTQEFPQRQQEPQARVEYYQQDSNIPAEPVPTPWDVVTQNDNPAALQLQEDEFLARQREREARIVLDSKDIDLPTVSLEERNRLYRQHFHSQIVQDREEANKRGQEIVDRINKARAERGEPLIGEAAREEIRESRQSEARRSQEDPRRRRYSEEDDQQDSRRRTDYRSRPRSDDRRNTINNRLDRRIQQYQEHKAQTHSYSEHFNPSMSLYQGNDEVDFELGHELPDPVDVKDMYRIASRDGTVKEGRRTNRDWDELPDDGSSYLDVNEFGPMGRSFYAPELPPRETQEELENRIDRTRFPENAETDIQELMQIKDEIEMGMSSEERAHARKDRELNKAMQQQQKDYTEGVHHGTWGELVPLPKAHRPETADLDLYEPPVITHDSFKYGIPSLPFGAQGRLRAAQSAAYDITEPLATSYDLEGTEMQDLRENPKKLQEHLDNIINLMDLHKPPAVDRIEPFVRGTERSQDTSERPGKEFDFGRMIRFTDMYSDAQFAIWREMNAGSFAPPNVQPPEPEDEDYAKSPKQRTKEGRQLLDAHDVVEQVAAATLKNFRKRDEFEIRDIRRRLGLPIDNGTFMAEQYTDKTSLTGILLNYFG